MRKVGRKAGKVSFDLLAAFYLVCFDFSINNMLCGLSAWGDAKKFSSNTVTDSNYLKHHKK
jgi:hypothetical protein